jgi:hypothetical protein
VEAHAALPHREDLERVIEEVHRLVEQHVAEPAAEDHAEHAVEEHVVYIVCTPAGQHVAPRLDAPEHQHEHERDGRT